MDNQTSSDDNLLAYSSPDLLVKFNKAMLTRSANQTTSGDGHRISAELLQIKKVLYTTRLSSRSVDVVRFWRNIYRLMSTADTQSTLLWSCMTIVEEACRQVETKDLLVTEMLFVPMIGEIVLRLNGNSSNPSSEKKLQAFAVLDELTRNYSHTVDANIFAALIKHLLQLVDQHAQSTDHRHLASVSLSILVNLCAHNHSAAQHLMHQIQLSSFTATLCEFPLLGARMSFIIAQNTHHEDALDTQQQHNPMVLVNEQILVAMRDSNAQTIRRITGLLGDMRRQQSHRLPEKISPFVMPDSFASVCEQVVEALDREDGCKATQRDKTEGEDSLLPLSFKVALLQMVDALVQICSKSFVNVYDRLISTALQMANYDAEGDHDDVHYDQLAIVALRTVLCIVEHSEHAVASAICTSLMPFVEENLLHRYQRQTDENAPKMVALLRLLDASLTVVPTISLAGFPADSFDRMFQPLLDGDVVGLTLGDDCRLRQYVHALHLMVRFCELDPAGDDGKRKKRVSELMHAAAVQQLLARANSLGNLELQCLVFGVARSPDFPAQSICKISAMFHRPMLATKHSSSRRSLLETRLPLSPPPPATTTNCCTLSQPRTARLDRILHHIQNTADAKSRPANSSLVLELYTHKLRDCEQREQLLQQRLDRALRTVIEQSQDLAVQSSEFERYDAIVLASVATEERLRASNAELQAEADTHHRSLQQFHAKLDATRHKADRDRREFEQRLGISATEIENYKQQIETEQRKYDAEAKRYARELKEQQQRLKQLQHSYDGTVQTVNRLETSVAELEATNRRLADEAAEEKARCRGELETAQTTIQLLEKTVAEKQAELEGMGEENEELQAIRDKIMNMIGTKKPRKK